MKSLLSVDDGTRHRSKSKVEESLWAGVDVGPACASLKAAGEDAIGVKYRRIYV